MVLNGICFVFTVRRKLLSVLDAIDFSQDIPELLQLDFFERTQIEQVISNCEQVNEQGHTVCNVKVHIRHQPASFAFAFMVILLSYFWKCVLQLLHRVLVAEVNALQGMAAIGQRPLLMEVIELTCHVILKSNKFLFFTVYTLCSFIIRK